jgi:hypothetical protein
MANVADVTRKADLKLDAFRIYFQVQHHFVFADFDTGKVFQTLEGNVQA